MIQRKSYIRTLATVALLAVAITLNAGESYQTTADLNLRSGPSPKYNSIRVIKKGENVILIEKGNPAWFKVEYMGKDGFLSSKFLTLVAVEAPTVVENPKIDPKPEESNNTVYILSGVVVVIVLIINL